MIVRISERFLFNHRNKGDPTIYRLVCTLRQVLSLKVLCNQNRDYVISTFLENRVPERWSSLYGQFPSILF